MICWLRLEGCWSRGLRDSTTCQCKASRLVVRSRSASALKPSMVICRGLYGSEIYLDCSSGTNEQIRRLVGAATQLGLRIDFGDTLTRKSKTGRDANGQIHICFQSPLVNVHKSMSKLKPSRQVVNQASHGVVLSSSHARRDMQWCVEISIRGESCR